MGVKQPPEVCIKLLCSPRESPRAQAALKPPTVPLPRSVTSMRRAVRCGRGGACQYAYTTRRSSRAGVAWYS